MEDLTERLARVARDLDLEVLDTAPDGLLLRLPTHPDAQVCEVQIRRAPTALTPEKALLWKAQRGEGTILGAPRITPGTARRLEAAGIEYFDALGNADIRRRGFRLHIEGRRGETVEQEQPILREPLAFGSAAMRLVFALLLDPTLAHSTLDELAEVAGVSKGAVHYTVGDLRAAGVMSQGRRNYTVVDAEHLAQLWVDQYPTRLLPRLKQAAFAGPEPHWWETQGRRLKDVVVGGGPALKHYGADYDPTTTVVYGTPPWKTARQGAARHPSAAPPNGQRNVILRERFWRSDRPWHREAFVPPLLAYADALASGEPRQMEVAMQLRRAGWQLHA